MSEIGETSNNLNGPVEVESPSIGYEAGEAQFYCRESTDAFMGYQNDRIEHAQARIAKLERTVAELYGALQAMRDAADEHRCGLLIADIALALVSSDPEMREKCEK